MTGIALRGDGGGRERTRARSSFTGADVGRGKSWILSSTSNSLSSLSSSAEMAEMAAAAGLGVWALGAGGGLVGMMRARAGAT